MYLSFPSKMSTKSDANLCEMPEESFEPRFAVPCQNSQSSRYHLSGGPPSVAFTRGESETKDQFHVEIKPDAKLPTLSQNKDLSGNALPNICTATTQTTDNRKHQKTWNSIRRRKKKAKRAKLESSSPTMKVEQSCSRMSRKRKREPIDTIPLEELNKITGRPVRANRSNLPNLRRHEDFIFYMQWNCSKEPAPYKLCCSLDKKADPNSVENGHGTFPSFSTTPANVDSSQKNLSQTLNLSKNKQLIPFSAQPKKPKANVKVEDVVGACQNNKKAVNKSPNLFSAGKQQLRIEGISPLEVQLALNCSVVAHKWKLKNDREAKVSKSTLETATTLMDAFSDEETEDIAQNDDTTKTEVKPKDSDKESTDEYSNHDDPSGDEDYHPQMHEKRRRKNKTGRRRIRSRKQAGITGGKRKVISETITFDRLKVDPISDPYSNADTNLTVDTKLNQGIFPNSSVIDSDLPPILPRIDFDRILNMASCRRPPTLGLQEPITMSSTENYEYQGTKGPEENETANRENYGQIKSSENNRTTSNEELQNLSGVADVSENEVENEEEIRHIVPLTLTFGNVVITQEDLEKKKKLKPEISFKPGEQLFMRNDSSSEVTLTENLENSTMNTEILQVFCTTNEIQLKVNSEPLESSIEKTADAPDICSTNRNEEKITFPPEPLKNLIEKADNSRETGNTNGMKDKTTTDGLKSQIEEPAISTNTCTTNQVQEKVTVTESLEISIEQTDISPVTCNVNGMEEKTIYQNNLEPVIPDDEKITDDVENVILGDELVHAVKENVKEQSTIQETSINGDNYTSKGENDNLMNVCEMLSTSNDIEPDTTNIIQNTVTVSEPLEISIEKTDILSDFCNGINGMEEQTIYQQNDFEPQILHDEKINDGVQNNTVILDNKLVHEDTENVQEQCAIQETSINANKNDSKGKNDNLTDVGDLLSKSNDDETPQPEKKFEFYTESLRCANIKKEIFEKNLLVEWDEECLTEFREASKISLELYRFHEAQVVGPALDVLDLHLTFDDHEKTVEKTLENETEEFIIGDVAPELFGDVAEQEDVESAINKTNNIVKAKEETNMQVNLTTEDCATEIFHPVDEIAEELNIILLVGDTDTQTENEHLSCCVETTGIEMEAVEQDFVINDKTQQFLEGGLPHCIVDEERDEIEDHKASNSYTEKEEIVDTIRHAILLEREDEILVGMEKETLEKPESESMEEGESEILESNNQTEKNENPQENEILETEKINILDTRESKILGKRNDECMAEEENVILDQGEHEIQEQEERRSLEKIPAEYLSKGDTVGEEKCDALTEEPFLLDLGNTIQVELNDEGHAGTTIEFLEEGKLSVQGETDSKMSEEKKDDATDASEENGENEIYEEDANNSLCTTNDILKEVPGDAVHVQELSDTTEANTEILKEINYELVELVEYAQEIEVAFQYENSFTEKGAVVDVASSSSVYLFGYDIGPRKSGDTQDKEQEHPRQSVPSMVDKDLHDSTSGLSTDHSTQNLEILTSEVIPVSMDSSPLVRVDAVTEKSNEHSTEIAPNDNLPVCKTNCSMMGKKFDFYVERMLSSSTELSPSTPLDLDQHTSLDNGRESGPNNEETAFSDDEPKTVVSTVEQLKSVDDENSMEATIDTASAKFDKVAKNLRARENLTDMKISQKYSEEEEENENEESAEEEVNKNECKNVNGEWEEEQDSSVVSPTPHLSPPSSVYQPRLRIMVNVKGQKKILIRHYQSLFKCHVCRRYYQYPKEAALCLQDHGKKKCWICLTIIPHKMDLFRAHNKRMHEKYTVQCPFCPVKLPYALKLRHHVEAYHCGIAKKHLSTELARVKGRPCKKKRRNWDLYLSKLTTISKNPPIPVLDVVNDSSIVLDSTTSATNAKKLSRDDILDKKNQHAPNFTIGSTTVDNAEQMETLQFYRCSPKTILNNDSYTESTESICDHVSSPSVAVMSPIAEINSDRQSEPSNDDIVVQRIEISKADTPKKKLADNCTTQMSKSHHLSPAQNLSSELFNCLSINGSPTTSSPRKPVPVTAEKTSGGVVPSSQETLTTRPFKDFPRRNYHKKDQPVTAVSSGRDHLGYEQQRHPVQNNQFTCYQSTQNDTARQLCKRPNQKSHCYSSEPNATKTPRNNVVNKNRSTELHATTVQQQTPPCYTSVIVQNQNSSIQHETLNCSNNAKVGTLENEQVRLPIHSMTEANNSHMYPHNVYTARPHYAYHAHNTPHNLRQSFPDFHRHPDTCNLAWRPHYTPHGGAYQSQEYVSTPEKTNIPHQYGQPFIQHNYHPASVLSNQTNGHQYGHPCQYFPVSAVGGYNDSAQHNFCNILTTARNFCPTQTNFVQSMAMAPPQCIPNRAPHYQKTSIMNHNLTGEVEPRSQNPIDLTSGAEIANSPLLKFMTQLQSKHTNSQRKSRHFMTFICLLWCLDVFNSKNLLLYECDMIRVILNHWLGYLQLEKTSDEQYMIYAQLKSGSPQTRAFLVQKILPIINMSDLPEPPPYFTPMEQYCIQNMSEYDLENLI